MSFSHTILPTADGSHTLYVPELDETYHSRHGAIAESLHVFIRHGLKALHHSESITLLEVGFGTGLNCLLTLLEQQQSRQHIHYIALEPFPLPQAVISVLNYSDNMQADAAMMFNDIHAAAWDTPVVIRDQFTLHKLHAPLSAFNQPGLAADLVYFDAFAPSKQPDLWTIEMLDIVQRHMAKSGRLVTYCAQGQFKRNLKQLGFNLQHPPGPHGKFEMTVALK